MANNLPVTHSTIISDTNHNLTSSYVPSAELKSNLRSELGCIQTKLVSFMNLYNKWDNGLMKSDWTVVGELGLRASALENSMKRIHNNCSNDRKNQNITQSLSIDEENELSSLMDKVSPLELLAILKSNIH